MAVVVIPVAIGVYELCLLAAAGLATLFVASPQGQKATREAALQVADALEKARQKPQKAPDKEWFPVPPPISQTCPKEKQKPEKCPVCEILPNPTPGVIPPYCPPHSPNLGRVPLDSETIPPLTSYRRTEMRVKGATVWRKPDATYIHRDTLHVGKAAELETYSLGEKHTGTICPHCSAPQDGPDKDKKLRR